MRADRWLSYLFLAVLAAGFAFFAVTASGLTPYGLIAAVLVTLLFAACGLRAVPPLLNAFRGVSSSEQAESFGARSGRFSLMHPWVSVLAFAVVSRILIYLFAYGIDLAVKGYSGGLFEKLPSLLMQNTDAAHYLDIAKNGYVTAGDARFFIVFFPFYPVLIRAFSFLTGEYFLSALLVSNLCFFGACLVLYELALREYGKKSALRAVHYLCILPASFFFAAPMSESTFLLLTLLCFFFLKKKLPLLAGLFGMLASLTRSLGIVLLVPCLIEWISDLAAMRRAGEAHFAPALLKRIFSAILILLGLGIYIYINYAVTGDPFRFMTYQKEHWSQSIGWFFNTAHYQTNYAVSTLSGGDLASFLGLWLPNLLALVLGLAVIFPNIRKLRASETCYHLCYYFAAMGATWLLSAPRYLAASFPFTLSLSECANTRLLDTLLSVISLLGLVLYLAAFVLGYPVY